MRYVPSFPRFVEIGGTICGPTGLVIVGFLSSVNLWAVAIDRPCSRALQSDPGGDRVRDRRSRDRDLPRVER